MAMRVCGSTCRDGCARMLYGALGTLTPLLPLSCPSPSLPLSCPSPPFPPSCPSPPSCFFCPSLLPFPAAPPSYPFLLPLPPTLSSCPSLLPFPSAPPFCPFPVPYPQIYDIHKTKSIAKEQLVHDESDFLYSASFCWIRGEVSNESTTLETENMHCCYQGS